MSNKFSIRESLIEGANCLYAESRGWTVLKLDGGGSNGKPDRVYLRAGVTMFIEYKRKGEHLKPLQEYWRRVLIGQGFDHHVVDNLEDGKIVVDSYG